MYKIKKAEGLLYTGGILLGVGLIKKYRSSISGSGNFEAGPTSAKGVKYSLPPLPYQAVALSPSLSGETVKLHHDKHEASYIDGMNQAFNTLNRVRKSNYDVDARQQMRQSIAKRNAFCISGSILHELYWKNLNGKGTKPSVEMLNQIKHDFGTLDMFMQEFFDIAKTIPGSGWGVLAYSPELCKLVILPVQKHENMWIPNAKVLMVIDVWEHAYYLDYQNRRGDYLKKMMNQINWDVVSERYKKASAEVTEVNFK